MKIGVISDIHSDIVSLKMVLNDLESQNVENIFCCGDIIGYGLFPDAIVKTILLTV